MTKFIISFIVIWESHMHQLETKEIKRKFARIPKSAAGDVSQNLLNFAYLSSCFSVIDKIIHV